MIPEENIPKLPPFLKWIPGYRGLYAISRKGDVYSYSVSTPRKLVIFSSGLKGYPTVNIYKPKPYDEHVIEYNKSKQHVVANLVLRTYGPPPPSPDHSRVLYKDENVKNIDISNLAWTTQADIARKTLNRIKHNMKRKRKRQIVVVINGRNHASTLLGTNLMDYMNTQRPTKQDFLVFSPEGYLKYMIEKGYTDPSILNAEYR